MSSINTNFAAMTALQSLEMTNKQMTQTQNAISTGLRVSSAQDNAAYWSIATTMKNDNSSLSSVQDSLGLGSSTANVAYTGMNQAMDVVNQIKNQLVTALEPGVDRTKIQSQITQLQAQLKTISDAASFSGQNWLSVDSSATGYNATKSIVDSFTRASDGSVSIGTIDVDTSKTALFDANAAGGGILNSKRDATGAISATGTASIATLDVSALTDSAADQTTLKGYIQDATAAVNEMTASASTLGAVQNSIDTQKSFVTALQSSITQGVSTLVDADMNQESTQLQALQVKQQLGVQALAMANSSNQSILSLFR